MDPAKIALDPVRIRIQFLPRIRPDPDPDPAPSLLIKNIKFRLRTYLLDESLEAELICSVTELEPDYIKLVKEIECHISN